MGMRTKVTAMVACVCMLAGLAACGGQTAATTAAGGTNGGSNASACQNPADVKLGTTTLKDAMDGKQTCVSEGSGKLDDNGKVTVTISDETYKNDYLVAIKFTTKNDGDTDLLTASNRSPDAPYPTLMYITSDNSASKNFKSAVGLSENKPEFNSDEASQEFDNGDINIPAHSEKELWAFLAYTGSWSATDLEPESITGMTLLLVGTGTKYGVYKTLMF